MVDAGVGVVEVLGLVPLPRVATYTPTPTTTTAITTMTTIINALIPRVLFLFIIFLSPIFNSCLSIVCYLVRASIEVFAVPRKPRATSSY